MALLEAVDEALQYVITWTADIYYAFCDWIGISEWVPITVTGMVVAAILGKRIWNHYH